MIKYLLTFIIFSLISFDSPGQSWRQLLYRGETDFETIRKAFYKEWQNKPTGRGSGYNQFKRWEEFMADRLNDQGQITNIAENYFLKKKLDSQHAFAKRNESENHYWAAMGPLSWTNDTFGYNPGHGRINSIFAVGDSLGTVYVGAPVGGIWKQTSQQTGWELLTEDLTNVGITDIYVDPDNSQRIMILTGDAYSNVSHSIGVLFSEDGGQTWEHSGLKHEDNSDIFYYKMEVIPGSKETILVAGNRGISRSVDNGTSWNTVLDVSTITDLIIHPTADSIIYASGVADSRQILYYRSEDYGKTWTNMSSNVPVSNGVGRTALAVSPARPDYLYLLVADNSGGYEGLYRSEDQGLSFIRRSDSPNIINRHQNSSGGQGIYDLALAVNPRNADEVYVGGFFIFLSLDGGRNFDRITNWLYNKEDPRYVHADIHTLDFFNGKLYSGCDGGIFRADTVSDGGALTSVQIEWQDMSDGLDITMFYRIGGDPSDETVIAGGTQDNGSNILRSGEWYHIYGADGMEAIIDHTDPDIVYASSQFGSIYRFSGKGESDFERISGSGITERGAWITPFVMHPDDHNILLAGYTDVYQTTDQGRSWEKISDFNSSLLIRDLKVAATNPAYIYLTNGDDLLLTTDGGETWGSRVAGLPERQISSLAVSEMNEKIVWVTLSGLNHDEKVFQSIDGGVTWENISAGIPEGLHVNCIVAQNNSAEQLYLGTDAGVFEKDFFENEWTFFSEGLPGIIVRELEIHYGSGKLRAATFGRGIWETDIIPGEPVSFEVKGIISDAQDIQEGSIVNFSADVEGRVISYEWDFEGGTPRISKDANPRVFYPDGGNFNVTLTLKGLAVSETIALENYITVSSVLSVDDDSGLFEVYPNPATDKITIRFESNSGEYQMYLLDINGRKLIYHDFKDFRNEPEVSLEGIGEGVYFVVIDDGRKKMIRKIFVN